MPQPWACGRPGWMRLWATSCRGMMIFKVLYNWKHCMTLRFYYLMSHWLGYYTQCSTNLLLIRANEEKWSTWWLSPSKIYPCNFSVSFQKWDAWLYKCVCSEKHTQYLSVYLSIFCLKTFLWTFITDSQIFLQDCFWTFVCSPLFTTYQDIFYTLQDI